MYVVLQQAGLMYSNTIFALDLSPSNKRRQHRVAVVPAGWSSLVCRSTYQLLAILFWNFMRISKGQWPLSRDYCARYVLAQVGGHTGATKAPLLTHGLTPSASQSGNR
jgi:hypothetical protein